MQFKHIYDTNVWREARPTMREQLNQKLATQHKFQTPDHLLLETTCRNVSVLLFELKHRKIVKNIINTSSMWIKHQQQKTTTYC